MLEMFVDFFKTEKGETTCRAVWVENPADVEKLEEQLASIASDEGLSARYVFDSLTGMVDLWGDEEVALRFFGRFCPRLYDLATVAYWLLEKDAHSGRFLAKLQHITQVVLEVAVSRGVHTLTVRKATNRRCPDIGLPERFDIDNDPDLFCHTECI